MEDDTFVLHALIVTMRIKLILSLMSFSPICRFGVSLSYGYLYRFFHLCHFLLAIASICSSSSYRLSITSPCRGQHEVDCLQRQKDHVISTTTIAMERADRRSMSHHVLCVGAIAPKR